MVSIYSVSKVHLHETVAVMTHSLKLVTLPDYGRQWWIQTGLKLGLLVVRMLGLLIVRIFHEAQLCPVTAHRLSVIFPHQVGASPCAGLSWEGLVV